MFRKTGRAAGARLFFAGNLCSQRNKLYCRPRRGGRSVTRHAGTPERGASAKAQCRAAYGRAKAAGGLATAIADKVWSDTLLSVENQRPETRTEMYKRTMSLFALLADRQAWPR